MSDLDRHLTDYLTVRRALGFKLVGEGQLLAEFVACADAAGQRTITTQFALDWARRPTSGSRNYLSRRLRSGPRVCAVSARARPDLRDPADRAAPGKPSTGPRRTSIATRRSWR